MQVYGTSLVFDLKTGCLEVILRAGRRMALDP